MASNDSHYSHSQGVKLLESAVNEFGPIFTLEQLKPISSSLKLSQTHLRFLISSLSSAGWIEIIKRGTYVVKSPLYSGDIPPFAIAAALINPIAISHWSACAHHGFSTQIPTMVQASTPMKVITPEMRSGKAHSPRGRAIWRAFGIEIEFIHMAPDVFWGFEKNWVNSWQQVNITDPERTALDLIARPDIFGGLSSAIEILENALSLIDIDRLVEYALKYDTGSVIKRLGWTLENLGVKSEAIDPLQKYPVRRYYLLDPNFENGGIKKTRWKVIENLKRS
ncbi:MAG: type IV toxin-antitoxin system AbiEi family antitoxin [Anaerolineaceae bacterium]|nr:type IV toxin-antitoxin system AbiEi family antitoxin [Anaerolineaceae bacterium]